MVTERESVCCQELTFLSAEVKVFITQLCGESRGRKRNRDAVTRGVRQRERRRECKNHNTENVQISSLNKCSLCHGPYSPLKWWGLQCKVCNTVWHSYCFERTFKGQNILDKNETTDKETDEETDDGSDDRDPDYVPNPESEEEEISPSPMLLAASPSTPKILTEEHSHLAENQKPSSDRISEKDDTKSLAKGQNFCFVCKQGHFKIARHFKTHEKEDRDIAKALSFPSGSKKRKELLEKLRNRGNFMYNSEILTKGKGSLKVKRSAKGDGTYEYCIHCKGMFLRKELWRHMRRCSSRTEEEHIGRKRVLGLASLMKSSCSETVESNVLKLLSRMQDDDIASVVRNDFCLLRFIESLYSRHGHDQSKHDYIRQKSRELGRFLITLRKISPIVNLEKALKPEHFLTVIEAVKQTAGFDKAKNNYKTPSLALKIGHSLLKVSDLIHCHALMTADEPLIKSSEAFQKLYQSKWSEYISCSALTTMSDLNYNNAVKLPLTQDVAKLHKYLDKLTESAIKDLKADANATNYSILAKTTLTKIILFNRRRVGEVSKMKLTNFMDRNRSSTQEKMGLSEYEQKLCSYFERVELKGKRGRKVAVLLTPEMTRAVELMVTKRKECGIPDDNTYLFAVPKCLTYYRGHDALRTLSEQCGAKKPEYLRSTQLRKEIATTSQILNLKDNELDQLADFLGHDISVHRQFYRLSEPTVQSAKISKLLLALEKGRLRELKGKTLDDIEEFSDKDEDESEDGNSSSDNESQAAPGYVAVSESSEMDFSSSVGTSSKVTIRRKMAYTRRPWSTREVSAVMKHFKTHIIKSKLATKGECEFCKTSEPVLQGRTWQNIRDFVRNKGLASKHKFT
ncbi:uncharacterized protein [Nothobranchius furzeri]|uniref:uncharacterized protein isoform X1 n=2 Tax=Nothobranchius furzeri TaxID=105023 RepID=UPI003904B535